MTRRSAAFASGAQYVSTDYLWADPRFPTYEVRLVGAAASICNPVRTANRCDDLAVELTAEATPSGHSPHGAGWRSAPAPQPRSDARPEPRAAFASGAQYVSAHR